MKTLIVPALSGQFGAALTMLRNCLAAADDATWHAPVGRFPFWHVAYHVLFYTDLYLSPGESAFTAQPFHLEDYNYLGQQSWTPKKTAAADRPYDRATIVGYVDTCRAKAKATFESETEATLAGPTGFSWLPFSRLEGHLYNLRHIQHHTGQLSALLRRQQTEGLGWVRTEPL